MENGYFEPKSCPEAWLMEQLAAKDALIAKLRGIIMKLIDRWWVFVHDAVFASQTAKDMLHEASDAVQPQQEETALRELIAKERKAALVEAANLFENTYSGDDPVIRLRRMAEEQGVKSD